MLKRASMTLLRFLLKNVMQKILGDSKVPSSIQDSVFWSSSYEFVQKMVGVTLGEVNWLMKCMCIFAEILGFHNMYNKKRDVG